MDTVELEKKLRDGRWSPRLQQVLLADIASGAISEVTSVTPQAIGYVKDGVAKTRQHPDARWSVYQRDVFRAVSSGVGHYVIKARAGAGKTSTLVESCKRLPDGTKACACAFNKDIERELQARIRGVPERGVAVAIMTLHVMGLRAVQKAWGRVQADDKDTWNEDWLKALPRQAPRGAINKIASLAKGMLVEDAAGIYRMATARGLWPETYGPQEDKRILGWIQDYMAHATRQHQLIGFDDMVYVAAKLGLVGERYGVIFVDETQDMCAAQLKVARQHLAPEGRMFVIGDDRQAIYGFRGADQDGMKRMQDELKAKVLPLSVTYRCATSIVSLAKTMVPDLEAAPGAPAGQVLPTSELELPKLWQEGDAVVSRTNAPAVKLCLMAIREGKRARMAGKKDLGKEIAGILRKSGATSTEQLRAFLVGWRDDALAKIPKAEADEDSTKQEEAATRIFDMYETLLCLAEGLKTVVEVQARVEEIFSDADGKNVLLFSSTHKAKGLEWERVFLLQWTYRSRQGGEEENLYYVAVTRAKNTLYLVSQSA